MTGRIAAALAATYAVRHTFSTMAPAVLALWLQTACQEKPGDSSAIAQGSSLAVTEVPMSQRVDRNYPPLIKAVLADDASAVRAALAAGADPSEPVQKVTPLGWALDGLKCAPEVVRALAEAGADLEAPIWPSEISPLHLALNHVRLNPARRGCVEVLLEFGADIHKLDRLGGSSIHAAAHGGMLDMVNRFAEQGVDVNEITTTGWTAMMFAALNGDEPMIRRMLELGADPCVREPDGDTVASIAGRMGLAALSRELEEICRRRASGRQS